MIIKARWVHFFLFFLGLIPFRGKIPTWRKVLTSIPPWPGLGVFSDTTSPAPPGGNGGRKNVEGGSKFPPGRLLDGEAERWTDDNGTEARAWESPQGDLHPATCWLRLLYAKCTELRPSQQIWQGDPPHTTPLPPSSSIHFSHLPVSPLSLLPPSVDTQPGGDELTQRVQTSLGALSPPLSLCTFFIFIMQVFKGYQISAKLPSVTVQFIKVQVIQVCVEQYWTIFLSLPRWPEQQTNRTCAH